MYKIDKKEIIEGITYHSSRPRVTFLRNSKLCGSAACLCVMHEIKNYQGESVPQATTLGGPNGTITFEYAGSVRDGVTIKYDSGHVLPENFLLC
jgi:hypothetical protein